MWLLLAFVSATLLGFYDASKKAALKDNAVLPVLLLNTLFSTVIFSPFLLDTLTGSDWFGGTIVDTAPFAGNLDLPVDPDRHSGRPAGRRVSPCAAFCDPPAGTAYLADLSAARWRRDDGGAV